MKTYKHLFFDLDHTLWDFDTNARETLLELYIQYDLRQLGILNAAYFIEIYTRNNHALWAQYHRGEITKEFLRSSRFRKTFLELGVDENLVPHQFEEDYVNICPTKTNLFPGTIEVLEHLRPNYSLHIITNGFYESSMLKIKGSGLFPYFQTITCSETFGANKPDQRIFEHAMDSAGAKLEESLMIGDSLEADIKGAHTIGMDCIFFNPNNLPHSYPVLHDIKDLHQLKRYL